MSSIGPSAQPPTSPHRNFKGTYRRSREMILDIQPYFNPTRKKKSFLVSVCVIVEKINTVYKRFDDNIKKRENLMKKPDEKT
jgi:hypothetical protein